MVEHVMAWIELHITTTAEHADTLGDQLSEWGAQAITLLNAGSEAIYEPAPGETPVWNNTTLIALFDDQDDLSQVLNEMTEKKSLGWLQDFYVKALPDQDWERVCLQDFKPLQFGKRLWICPSWETPPDPQAINVILDPGLAFGTGTSPTTALCLEWLESHVKEGDSVTDYGCGSGILALAALKLGAEKVFAVDYDPQALDATKLNSERNQITPKQIETFLPDDFTPQKVDIVIANILAKSLIELAPLLTSMVKPQGQILLSGILREQAEQVLDVYQQWFKMEEPAYKDEWTRLVGLRLL